MNIVVVKLIVWGGLVLGPLSAGAAERADVDFDYVRARAEALAAKAYEADETALPEVLAQMGYDRYRSIRFAPEQSMWRGDRLPFTLQFFHLGGLFRAPVRVHDIGLDGITINRRVVGARASPGYFQNGRQG